MLSVHKFGPRPPVGVALNPANAGNAGLKLWLLCNERGGTVLYSSALRKDADTEIRGTLTGATLSSAWVHGLEGPSLALDGSASYVDMGRTVDAETNFTVIARVRRKVASVRHDIVSSEPGVALGYTLTLLSNNHVGFGVFTGTSYPFAEGTTALTDTHKIYHLVGQRDAVASLYRVFADGKQEGTAATDVIGNSTVNLLIGRQGGVAQNYANVEISDVKIFNRCLTHAEILQDMLYPYGTRENPRLLCAPVRRTYKAATVSGSMQATMSGGCSSTLQIAGAGALSTTIAGSGSLVATIAATGAVLVAMTGVGAFFGGLAGSGALSSVWVGNGSVLGALIGKGVLAGTMAGTASAVIALSGAGAFQVGMSGSGTLNASIQGSGALLVALLGTGAMTNTLAGIGALNAVLAGTGNLSATIAGVGALIGSMAGIGTLSGSFANAGAMIAALVGSGALNAAIVATGALQVSMLGTGTLASSLSGYGAVIAAMLGTTSFSASIGGTGALITSLPGSANLLAALVGTGSLQAALNGTGNLSSIISASVSMAVAMLGSSAMSAAFPSSANAEVPFFVFVASTLIHRVVFNNIQDGPHRTKFGSGPVMGIEGN